MNKVGSVTLASNCTFRSDEDSTEGPQIDWMKEASTYRPGDN